jgi:hypothetical protein
MDFFAGGVSVDSRLVIGQSAGMPASASLDGTSMTIGALDLALHGNWAVTIAAQLEGLIAAALRRLLPSHICTQLDAFVATNGSAALRTLDASLAPFTAPPTETAEPHDLSAMGAVDLRGDGTDDLLDGRAIMHRTQFPTTSMHRRHSF